MENLYIKKNITLNFKQFIHVEIWTCLTNYTNVPQIQNFSIFHLYFSCTSCSCTCTSVILKKRILEVNTLRKNTFLKLMLRPPPLKTIAHCWIIRSWCKQSKGFLSIKRLSYNLRTGKEKFEGIFLYYNISVWIIICSKKWSIC